MDKSKAFVINFEDLTKDDVPLVGGKNASLGEMIKAGVPVPPGFAVTAYAYKYFLEKTGILNKVSELIETINIDDLEDLQEKSSRIRELIESTPLPPELEAAIKEAYAKLGEKVGMQDPPVAVRSSATAEDLPTASFAGQQETFLFVRGADDVLKYVVKCFSSLFTPRAIVYREEKGFEHMKVYLSVGVQKMVNSKAAGVAFTLDPVTGERGVVVIEGAWGVGETVVQGRVDPDKWKVDKSTLEIVERYVGDKRVKAVRSGEPGATGFVEEVETTPEEAMSPCLTDEQVRELAKYCIKIEEHYGRPQDIEWALDADTNTIYIVQSRPETVWSVRAEAVEAEPKAVTREEAKVLCRGLPASPGIGRGKARVLLDVSKIHEFQEGEVLVTEMTNPDWVPAMRKASAIVTDSGGMTSHAAIVSRELGIPCVVGARMATQVIKTGMDVTVDGSTGTVYEGIIAEERPAAAPAVAAESGYYPVTATKIYMNLGEPGKIEEYRGLPFDGIGLMRIEFIIADWIQYHPMALIEEGRPEVFVNKLAEGIAKVAQAVYPKPVVVRFSDFKTNEYAALKGGAKFEPKENNPMLGWRGVSRYVSPEYEPAFRLECRAIKKVREEYGLKNVWVMLPFVRTTWEVKRALQIMEEEGLKRGRDFKVWLMAEVPSNIFLADEFSELCDGFSIGSNDLTQLIMGADRDSDLLAQMGYFDERDPAVKRAIAHLIKVAHKHGVTVSICGQAPSVYEEFVEFLVRCGIDSISVNPDAVVKTRQLVASVEQRILLDRLKKLLNGQKSGKTKE